MHDINTIKNALIKKLSFKHHNCNPDLLIYNLGDGESAIKIEFNNENPEKSTIDYGSIPVGRETITNFSNDENFVVLECVIKLIELGYSYKDIKLEQKQISGKSTPVYVDIIIMKDSVNHIIIECKTFGAQYKKTVKEFSQEHETNQLLNYWIFDKNPKIAALYSSDIFSSSEVLREYLWVDTDYFIGNNLEEIHKSWDKSYETSNMFENNVLPYNIFSQPITISSLSPISSNDSGVLFNDLMEILRKNSVSDKPNAFNKIFNLFLAKIHDEDKQADREAEFVWRKGETADDVYNRISTLYRNGLNRYLGIQLYNNKICPSLAISIKDKQLIKELTKHVENVQKYNNSDFSFIDSFDEPSFRQNAKILQQVIEKIQSKRIRYSSKQQFMGDFFEKLLNTSIKQEAGQFFTPLPICRFICESMPVSEIINNKLNNDSDTFLPHTIDYASGSGHFLVEAMDIIDNELKEYVKKANNYGVTQRKNLNKWQNDFSWADEFIYGVEKDHRLAKTSKISCFLNGDGCANIITGNGLAPQKKVDEVVEKGGFDLVLSNPPYAVKGFIGDIREHLGSYALGEEFTDSSSEIEYLFIEKTHKLLKEEGLAALILPSSILNNTKQTSGFIREFILKNFKIKSIVYFGDKTFSDTPTKTITLFLQKRKKSEILEYEVIINSIVNDKNKNAVTEDGISLESVLGEEIINSLISGEENIEQIKKIALLKLCSDYNIPIIKSPTTPKGQKLFLGYEFSTRKGHEGINYLKGRTFENIDTDLYLNTEDKLNNIPESSKIAYYVKNSILDNLSNISIDSKFDDIISVFKLNDLLRFQAGGVSIMDKPSFSYSKCLGSILTNVQYKGYLNKIDWHFSGQYNIVSQEQNSLISGLTDDPTYIVNASPNDPVIVFGDHTCVVKFIDFPFVPGADGLKIFRVKNKSFDIAFISEWMKYLVIKFNTKNKLNGNERHWKYVKEYPLPDIDIKTQHQLNKHILKATTVERKCFDRLERLFYNTKYQNTEQLSKYVQVIDDKISIDKCPDGIVNIELENIVPCFLSIEGEHKTGSAEFKLVKSLKRNQFQQHDILYGTMRPYLNKVFYADNFNGLSVDTVAILRPNNPMIGKAISFILHKESTLSQVKDLTNDNGRTPVIKIGDLLEVKIPSLEILSDKITINHYNWCYYSTLKNYNSIKMLSKFKYDLLDSKVTFIP